MPRTEPTSALPDAVALRAGAIVAAALASIVFYATDRSIAVILHGPPDPLSGFASARIDYFWRIGIAFFIATLVYPGWLALMKHRAQAGWAVMQRSVVPVVVLACIASAIWP